MHRAACLLLVVLCVILSSGSARAAYDIVVAQDGTGDYTTVQAAILAVPDFHPTRTTIFIKAGTYYEKLAVPKEKHRVTLIGEDRDTTILTYDEHATVNPDESVTGTTDTPSIYIKGKDFAARNLTFSNTSGNVGPAIAVWVQGNRAHFRNCAFLGYQDTLCAFSKYAYFKHCYIEGAIDMIFGASTSVFQQCTIHCLGIGYITAADTLQSRAYGFVFKSCQIEGEAPEASVYLGRPWGEYANVVFVNCSMDDEIVPAGWDDWGDDSLEGTTFFAEYNSTGAGADLDDRVAWSYQLNAHDLGDYTLGKIFNLTDLSADSSMLLAAKTPWYLEY